VKTYEDYCKTATIKVAEVRRLNPICNSLDYEVAATYNNVDLGF
jgi:hypothetical protein